MRKLIYILVFIIIHTNLFSQSFQGSSDFTKPEFGDIIFPYITSTSVKIEVPVISNGGALINKWVILCSYDSPPTDTVLWSPLNYDKTSRLPMLIGYYVTGLISGFTYYVKVCANNIAGETCTPIYSVTLPASLSVPIVDISAATSISSTTATLNGNVSSDGGATVTGRGFYYSKNPIPTTGASSGSGTGTYNLPITGLEPYTTYYVRAYATNSEGTAVSENINSFTTNMLSGVPTVQTLEAVNISESSAIVGGNIIYDGNSGITESGVCYSTGSTPTISDSKSESGTTQGGFYLMLSPLLDNTTYYYRAYAINDNGVGYGSILSFTTLDETGLATVTTTTATNIGTSTVTLGGNVTDDGGSTVVSRGVCIGTSPNPTTGPGAGSGTGVFAVNHTNLTPGVNYYYRAYAVNSTGINYGAEYQFQTLIPSSVPSVSTLEAFNITDSTAISGGSIGYNGNSGIIESGVCYSTGSTPTIANSKVITGATSGGFYVMIPDLLPSTTYYFRAYSTNGVGTGYGSILSFTTSGSVNLPMVTISSMVSIWPSRAELFPNVLSDGGSLVTSRGLVWNTVGSPSLYSYTGVTANGTGTGSFTSNLSPMNCGKTYYAKAYATNSVGTAYSNQITVIAQDLDSLNAEFFVTQATIAGVTYNITSIADAEALIQAAYNAGGTFGQYTGTTYYFAGDVQEGAIPYTSNCTISSDYRIMVREIDITQYEAYVYVHQNGVVTYYTLYNN